MFCRFNVADGITSRAKSRHRWRMFRRPSFPSQGASGRARCVFGFYHDEFYTYQGLLLAHTENRLDSKDSRG